MVSYLKASIVSGAACAVLVLALAAGAASAKVCSTAGTGASCGSGHGNVYTGSFSSTSLSPEISSTLDNVFCTDSTFSGSITNGETGSASIESLTFSGCKDSTGGGSCTVVSNASSGLLTASINVNVAPNGTMRISPLTLEFTCTIFGSKVTCKYAGSFIEVEVRGSDFSPSFRVATVANSLNKETGSSSICSASANWKGTYNISTPTSLFVT